MPSETQKIHLSLDVKLAQIMKDKAIWPRNLAPRPICTDYFLFLKYIFKPILDFN